ncbi:MAG: zf-TFIIB domain-containing protein [Deltaproteobacteria bacterium]|nr:zf-TFIIB domain-containing protein [Deltaproteobacteria bacterium]
MGDRRRGPAQPEELARRRASRERDTQELTVQERESLRAQHWMRCPKCGVQLDEITFRGVKVDKCFGWRVGQVPGPSC